MDFIKGKIEINRKEYKLIIDNNYRHFDPFFYTFLDAFGLIPDKPITESKDNENI